MPYFKRTSIRDIAEAAGVSTTLVSFVLNGKANQYRINEETARRIIEIAKEMNYNPNIAAKSLRNGRSKIIGVVVSDISNPFFASIARLFEDEAAKYGYTVFFGSSDERADKMEHIIKNLMSRGVDGLVVVPCENTKDFISSLVLRDVSIVLLDRYFPGVKISSVALNNYETTSKATQHLLNFGYNSPGIVAYDVQLIHMQDRIKGYESCMRDAGYEQKIRTMRIAQGSPIESAGSIVTQALKQGVDSFIFATNLISLSCLYAIKDLGPSLTDRIGLIGFDGNPAFDFFSRPISYIQQPVSALVQKSLQLLMENMENQETQSILLDGQLVVKL